MTKIARVTQQIFGSGGLVGAGGFGAAAASNVTTALASSTALSTIMGTGAWGTGWLTATLGSSKFPAVEDMNARDFAVTTQLAYIFQQGLAIEYDAGTTYYTNSVVAKTGTYQFYGSKTNGNIGNALTDTGNWQYLGDLSQLSPNVFVGGTTTNSGNNYTLAAVSPATGLVPLNGQVVICTINTPNTSAAAFAITSPAIANTPIVKESGGSLVPLTGGELQNTAYLTWNSTAGNWVLGAGLPLGTAAYKAASSNGENVVASVHGTIIAGNIAFYNDSTGTLKDSLNTLPNGTTATTQAATDASSFVATTQQVASQPGVAKADVNFSVSGGTVTVNRAFNVSGVVRNSAGNYTVTFASAFADINYSVLSNSIGSPHDAYWTAYLNKTTSTVDIIGILEGTGPADNGEFSVVIFR